MHNLSVQLNSSFINLSFINSILFIILIFDSINNLTDILTGSISELLFNGNNLNRNYLNNSRFFSKIYISLKSLYLVLKSLLLKGLQTNNLEKYKQEHF